MFHCAVHKEKVVDTSFSLALQQILINSTLQFNNQKQNTKNLQLQIIQINICCHIATRNVSMAARQLEKFETGWF